MTTPTYSTTLQSAATAGDIQAAIDAGTAIAEPQQIDDQGRFVALTRPAGGSVQIVDVEELREKFRDTPRRKTGHIKLYDADSFAAYYRKHASDGVSEVYADVAAQRIVAVLNSHGPETPGWGDYRAELLLRKTPAWLAWENLNGKLLNQVSFAEHVENRLIDFAEPAGAVMLELAQTFQAKSKVTFESSKRLSSGERQLEYREDVQASAGRKGDITIPEQFVLGLIPFEGAEAYRVVARLRYRLTDGSLAIGYALERPEDVLRAAFTDVVDAVEERLGIDALRGVAP